MVAPQRPFTNYNPINISKLIKDLIDITYLSLISHGPAVQKIVGVHMISYLW